MAMAVNGEFVDDSLIRQEAAALKQQLLSDGSETDMLALEMRAHEWAKENVIERVLLRQAADGEDVDRFVARLTESVPPAKNKEVTEHYRVHRDSYYTPELVRAAHIVKNVDETNDEATALAAIQAAKLELEKNRPFEEVADELSDCPGSGGDLGYFARGTMVDEFEAVVFALQPGQTSDIFRSAFGFHIVRLFDRKAAGVRTLNEVRPEIEQLLLRRKKQDMVNRWLDQVRARADIKKVSSRPVE